jgi:hypothetical protein
MTEPTKDDRPMWAKVVLYGYSVIMIAVIFAEAMGRHIIPTWALIPFAFLGFVLIVVTAPRSRPASKGPADNKWKTILWIGFCIALAIYLAIAFLQ